MSRRVLLSQEFRNRLTTLSSLEQEVNGVLLYGPQKGADRQQQPIDYCPVE